MTNYTTVINDSKETLEITSEQETISIPADGEFRDAEKIGIKLQNLVLDKGLENGFKIVCKSENFTAYLTHTEELFVVKNSEFESCAEVYVSQNGSLVVINFKKEYNELEKINALITGLSRSISTINKTSLRDAMHKEELDNYFEFIAGIYNEYLSTLGLKLNEDREPSLI